MKTNFWCHFLGALNFVITNVNAILTCYYFLSVFPVSLCSLEVIYHLRFVETILKYVLFRQSYWGKPSKNSLEIAIKRYSGVEVIHNGSQKYIQCKKSLTFPCKGSSTNHCMQYTFNFRIRLVSSWPLKNPRKTQFIYCTSIAHCNVVCFAFCLCTFFGQHGGKKL